MPNDADDHERTAVVRPVHERVDRPTVWYDKRSWLKISQLRTLSVVRLGERIAALSPELVNQAIDGLNEIVAA